MQACHKYSRSRSPTRSYHPKIKVREHWSDWCPEVQHYQVLHCFHTFAKRSFTTPEDPEMNSSKSPWFRSGRLFGDHSLPVTRVRVGWWWLVKPHGSWARKRPQGWSVAGTSGNPKFGSVGGRAGGCSPSGGTQQRWQRVLRDGLAANEWVDHGPETPADLLQAGFFSWAGDFPSILVKGKLMKMTYIAGFAMS